MPPFPCLVVQLQAAKVTIHCWSNNHCLTPVYAPQSHPYASPNLKSGYIIFLVINIYFHSSPVKMSSLFRNTAMLARRGVRMVQSRNYADEAMKLTFAAANKVFYDSVEVKQVDVPSFSGDFGILAAHVPTLGKWYDTLVMRNRK